MKMETGKPRKRKRRLFRKIQPGTAPGTVVADPNAHPSEIRVVVYNPDEVVEDKLDSEIHGFAYPFGLDDHIGRNVKNFVIETGYKYAVTALPGIVDNKSDVFCLKRLSMPGKTYSSSLWKIAKNLTN